MRHLNSVICSRHFRRTYCTWQENLRRTVTECIKFWRAHKLTLKTQSAHVIRTTLKHHSITKHKCTVSGNCSGNNLAKYLNSLFFCSLGSPATYLAAVQSSMDGTLLRVEFQLHNWTFFHKFHKEDCRKSFFFILLFFPGKKRFNFFSFHFSIQKLFLHTFYVLLFFPVKKDLFFTVLKLSTIKQAFVEKVQ